MCEANRLIVDIETICIREQTYGAKWYKYSLYKVILNAEMTKSSGFYLYNFFDVFEKIKTILVLGSVLAQKFVCNLLQYMYFPRENRGNKFQYTWAMESIVSFEQSWGHLINFAHRMNFISHHWSLFASWQYICTRRKYSIQCTVQIFWNFQYSLKECLPRTKS